MAERLMQGVKRRLTLYGFGIFSMRIVTIRDRRLKRFLEGDDVSKIPPQLTSKIRNVVTILSGMSDEEELSQYPHWRPHRLTGDLQGYWSLTLTRNWRLIFQTEDKMIFNLQLIDYH